MRMAADPCICRCVYSLHVCTLICERVCICYTWADGEFEYDCGYLQLKHWHRGQGEEAKHRAVRNGEQGNAAIVREFVNEH